jgi:hypothetical protein
LWLIVKDSDTLNDFDLSSSDNCMIRKVMNYLNRSIWLYQNQTLGLCSHAKTCAAQCSN